VFVRRVYRQGPNSLVVTLPRVVCNLLSLGEGDHAVWQVRTDLGPHPVVTLDALRHVEVKTEVIEHEERLQSGRSD